MRENPDEANRRRAEAAAGHLGMLEVAVPCMRHRYELGVPIREDLDRLERVLAEMRADLDLSPLLTKAER